MSSKKTRLSSIIPVVFLLPSFLTKWKVWFKSIFKRRREYYCVSNVYSCCIQKRNIIRCFPRFVQCVFKVEVNKQKLYVFSSCNSMSKGTINTKLAHQSTSCLLYIISQSLYSASEKGMEYSVLFITHIICIRLIVYIQPLIPILSGVLRVVWYEKHIWINVEMKMEISSILSVPCLA